MDTPLSRPILLNILKPQSKAEIDNLLSILGLNFKDVMLTKKTVHYLI